MGKFGNPRVLETRDHWFKSSHPDKRILNKKYYLCVVQSGSIAGPEPGDQGSNPCMETKRMGLGTAWRGRRTCNTENSSVQIRVAPPNG